MHLWVRLMPYFCTLRGCEFHSNDIPNVTPGGKMPHPENAGGVKEGFCEYFTIYWQWIVGWKHVQSQYHSSVVAQDMRVACFYSQVR